MNNDFLTSMDDKLVITFHPDFRLPAKEFQSPSEFLVWLNREQSELRGVYLDGNYSPFNRESSFGKGTRTRNTLEKLKEFASAWERNIAAGHPEGARQSLAEIRNLANYYHDGSAFPTECSLFGEFRVYRSISVNDDVTKGYMYARLGQPPPEHSCMQGYVEGVIATSPSLPIEAGDIERIQRAVATCEADAKQLSGTRAEQKALLGTSNTEWADFMQAVGTDLTDFANRRKEEEERQAAQFDESAKAFQTAHKRIVSDCEMAINNFQKRVETKISMGIPIQHWEAKAKQHATAFRLSMIAFVITAFAFTWIAYDRGLELMNQIEGHQLALAKLSAPVFGPALPDAAVDSTKDFIGGTGMPLHFLRLGILILGITLGVWFLRFIARILLSNMHLRDDARERVVMIKTFLAFNEAQVGLKPEDVQLTLASIFRPATSGLTSDDGIPPGVWDAITRLRGGGGN